MDNGRRRRFEPGGGSKSRPPPARRVPPPESTGLEARFLQGCKDSRAQVVVCLRTGEKHLGRIEYLDRDMIKLTCADGPNLFIRKNDIRYITEGKRI